MPSSLHEDVYVIQIGYLIPEVNEVLILLELCEQTVAVTFSCSYLLVYFWVDILYEDACVNIT